MKRAVAAWQPNRAVDWGQGGYPSRLWFPRESPS